MQVQIIFLDTLVRKDRYLPTIIKKKREEKEKKHQGIGNKPLFIKF